MVYGAVRLCTQYRNRYYRCSRCSGPAKGALPRYIPHAACRITAPREACASFFAEAPLGRCGTRDLGQLWGTFHGTHRYYRRVRPVYERGPGEGRGQLVFLLLRRSSQPYGSLWQVGIAHRERYWRHLGLLRIVHLGAS